MNAWLKGTEDPFKDLPPPLLAIALEIAKATQTPVSFAVVVILIVLSVVYQSRIVIESPSGQIGLASLFALIIGKPSSGKSEVYKNLLKGIARFYDEYLKEQQEHVKRTRAEQRMWETHLQAARRAVRSAGLDHPRISEFNARLWELEMNEPRLHEPELLVDGDASLHVLQNHFDGIGKAGFLMSQEAGQILTGPLMVDGTTLLNSLFTYDDSPRSRRGNQSRPVDARLAILFMAQHSVVEPLVENHNGVFNTSGLASRFIITSDAEFVGTGKINVRHLPLTDAFNDWVFETMRAPREPVKKITFGPAASELFETFRGKIHRDTQAGGPLDTFGAIALRTVDKSSRAAGILSEYVGESIISEKNYLCAKNVMVAFMFEAQEVLSLGKDIPQPERDGKRIEKYITLKILQGEAAQFQGPLTKRQLQRATHINMPELDPAVDYLVRQRKMNLVSHPMKNGAMRTFIYINLQHFGMGGPTSSAFAASTLQSDDEASDTGSYFCRDYGRSSGRY